MREAQPLVKVLFARRRSEGDKGRAEDKMNSADQIRREEIRSLKEKCLSDGKERWPHRSSQTPQSLSSSVTEDSVKETRQTFWCGQRLLGQVNLEKWCISQVCSGGRWGIIAPPHSRRRRGGVLQKSSRVKFDYFTKMLGTWGATGAAGAASAPGNVCLPVWRQHQDDRRAVGRCWVKTCHLNLNLNIKNDRKDIKKSGHRNDWGTFTLWVKTSAGCCWQPALVAAED